MLPKPNGCSTIAEIRILADTPESEYDITAAKKIKAIKYKTNLNTASGIHSDMIRTSEKYPKGHKSQAIIGVTAGLKPFARNKVQYFNS
jgi:hypothetical protein